MSEEFAGLGDVIYLKADDTDTIEIHIDGEFKIHESEEKRKRRKQQVQELLCTAPEGLLIPKGGGEYELVKLSEEQRNQLAEELWPLLYKKTTQASNSPEY